MTGGGERDAEYGRREDLSTKRGSESRGRGDDCYGESVFSIRCRSKAVSSPLHSAAIRGVARQQHELWQYHRRCVESHFYSRKERSDNQGVVAVLDESDTVGQGDHRSVAELSRIEQRERGRHTWSLPDLSSRRDQGCEACYSGGDGQSECGPYVSIRNLDVPADEEVSPSLSLRATVRATVTMLCEAVTA